MIEAIEAGDFPKWKFCVQLMPEREADSYRWHPFDLTKVWPHEDYPLIEVGEMVLNRNPGNYFEDVEQAAFEPSNVLPGIGFSQDKVLQNRVLSYSDAHRYRMGVNYHQVQVNRARLAKVNDYHRDGTLRSDGNGGNSVDYEPNSFGGPVEDHSVKEPPLRLTGNADNYAYKGDDVDLYGQPRALWEKVLDDTGRAHLVENIVASMSNPMMGIADPKPIQERMLKHWFKVHPEFGARIAKGLGFGEMSAAAE